jgi:hypothetical protein
MDKTKIGKDLRERQKRRKTGVNTHRFADNKAFTNQQTALDIS